METVEALHAYFCLLLASGVLSLTVSASVHPGARQDVMGQYRLTNRQQCHRLCWYRALCGSYSYHTESSAPLMDVSTPPPNCVLHAQNDSENCLCSVCLCSAHTTWRWELSVFCTHKMIVRIVCVLFVFCTHNLTVTIVSVLFVCVLHTQHDSENCPCSVCVLRTHDSENCLCSICLCSAHTTWRWELFSVDTTRRWELSVFCLSVFCTRNMTVRIVCVLHTQHDGENCLCPAHTKWFL